MKWYVKSLTQKILSLIPYGRKLNFLLQKQFGELHEINNESIIREILMEFITPIINEYGKISNLKIVEIGTGWVPILPIIISLYGGECITYDVVRHIDREILIKTLIFIREHLNIILPSTDLSSENIEEKLNKAIQASSIEDVLQILGLQYIAPFDTTQLPTDDSSQDVVISRLVLSSIPAGILPEVLSDLFRITKPGGLSIHTFGLHDEYASIDPSVTMINYLKYPTWFWDKFINNRIKYSNRARYPYYLNLFNKTGFTVISFDKIIDESSFKALASMKVSKEFKNYSKEELATVRLSVILRRPKQ